MTDKQDIPGWKFDRDRIRAFRFVRCGFDAASGIASLV